MSYKHLPFVTASMVAVLLISNIAAVKPVQMFGLITDGGTLLFPLAYIFGDVLTEVYGYQQSRRVIWTGFFWLLAAALIFQLVLLAPPADGYMLQESFEAILGQTPRIVAASLIAYLAGEFVNAFILSRMKVIMQGRALWMRTIGSTIAGQAVDTLLFVLIAFYGLDWASYEVLLNMIITGYLLKVSIEVLFTPVTYRVVHILKRDEGVDVYDEGIDYNPFLL